ncbi:hypothetical protein DFJ74DRAFT_713308 [Hyaloraphidium curvatum]|nr:hypothetical protein DFJ74DRAFT_713308 [Hyaloraphidium curvatum]
MRRASLVVTAVLLHAQAYCFYNGGTQTILVVDPNRKNDLSLFEATLAPGQKQCWFQGGTGGFCNPQSFDVAPISILSGDGVFVDLDAGWISLNPNAACGVPVHYAQMVPSASRLGAKM